MLLTELSAFYERDLRKLADEIDLYSTDEHFWAIPEGISNSGGTLCLHLIGNLHHFIGATLGHTGYIRQRDLEFSSRDIPRQVVKSHVLATIEVVKNTLAQLTDAQVSAEFPLEKHGGRVSTLHMLIHLFGHLNYHLGQVNYHRRLIHLD